MYLKSSEKIPQIKTTESNKHKRCLVIGLFEHFFMNFLLGSNIGTMDEFF